MIAFAAYFPIPDRPGDPVAVGLRLDRRRALLARYVARRGRVVAEFLEMSGDGKCEGVVLREARRYCRERGAILVMAAGDSLQTLDRAA